jgi:hypothetical protein
MDTHACTDIAAALTDLGRELGPVLDEDPGRLAVGLEPELELLDAAGLLDGLHYALTMLCLGVERHTGLRPGG